MPAGLRCGRGLLLLLLLLRRTAGEAAAPPSFRREKEKLKNCNTTKVLRLIKYHALTGTAHAREIRAEKVSPLADSLQNTESEEEEKKTFLLFLLLLLLLLLFLLSFFSFKFPTRPTPLGPSIGSSAFP